ncbi:MAG: hypothetical protein Q8906_04270 [Bacillota bacterium]|nr:hypothetical protein [Bacillota bacterium]MDP4169803.1 hypothetical protein [Bacillota bacterium]
MEISDKHPIHPTIRKCLQHLDIIEADEKTKQLVYMYMESLYKDMTKQIELETKDAPETNRHLL